MAKEIILSGDHPNISVYLDVPANLSKQDLLEQAIESAFSESYLFSQTFKNGDPRLPARLAAVRDSFPRWEVILSGQHEDIFVVVVGDENMGSQQLLNQAIKEVTRKTVIAEE